ncbi:ATP-dependent endonuclease [Bradyrhizobium liaoningense]|uniref:ATP-dependent nuclease n=1 Tax=Bradyrhizobium liaoningense TaxID=43992 RepID=UPI001BA75910|nr:AAA family ATPase [Bradyrhizobium liaoningense]MBR0945559.1 AAA family ATPase [Bradyrhizobium liaoningense]
MGPYQSEIRDSQVRELLQKVKANNYGSYLRRMKLLKVRAFQNENVEFDFPVTALIGTNGGGKSTILGAAAIAHKSIRPALFFPKSFIGDETMSEWGISYDIVQKAKNPTQSVQRSAKFKRSKWVRDDLIERPVLYFGIQRTVPAGERREFKKFATVNYPFSGKPTELIAEVQRQVAKVLGKDVSKFQHAAISESQSFYVGGDGNITYSEFHFGAGESSVIRMVSEIEAAPANALILIEEIENGLHPVAVRRMVEYLMDVAGRKSAQSIFTTHSEDALLPLPNEAIWSSIDGKARQGKVSIEALRAITGRIDESLAIFVEDLFAKEWVESIIRNLVAEHIDEIGVYAVSGDGQAYSIHSSHRKNPAIAKKLKSICILDGDSPKPADENAGVIKLPGQAPESEVFNYVASNIEVLSMKLAVALHLQPEQEERVKAVVKEVNQTNRDPHLIFSQVGQKAGLIPVAIVSSAFIGLWMQGNPREAQRIADFIAGKAEEETAPYLD